jgi:predicted nucleotidyltransferase
MVQPLAPTSFARQPLDVILSRAAAVRVLRALVRHGGLLPVTRIATEASLTPGGVRAVLDELVECRIVRVVGSGRTQLCQVPGDHPFVKALETLFEAEADRLDDMLQAVVSAAEHAAGDLLRAVWLFSSVARGKDVASSDLDVAVVFDAPDKEADEIVNNMRAALAAPGNRLGFRPSVVALVLKDIPRMSQDGSRLWADLQAEAKTLSGIMPGQLLRQVTLDRVAT